MTSCTSFSLSFISPSTLTEPGVMFSSRSISSGEANDSRATPSCFDKSFVLKTFSPGIMRR